MRLKKRFFKLLFLLVLAAALHQAWYFHLALQLRDQNPQSSAYIKRALEQGAVDQQWRDYPQISDHLKRAVLISEDSQFMDHGGFDWHGIRYALQRNLEAGETVAGGSTITQQLAKNLYLSGERSYLRKGREALIAMTLEWALPKRRILELYLNVVQWGHGVFGAQAAAQHYFQVNAAALSPHQAAQLAAMLPRPNYYDFRGPSEYLQERADWIVPQLALVAIPDPDQTASPMPASADPEQGSSP